MDKTIKNKSTSSHSRSTSRSRRHARRGVGTIIAGAMIAGILFTSVYVYFWTIMQSQEVRGKADAEIQTLDNEKRMEDIVAVTAENMTTHKIDIMVNNTGTIPMKLTALFVYDNAFVPLTPPSGAVDVTINGGRYIVFPTLLDADPTKNYKMDVISERGNVVSAPWPPNDLFLSQNQVTQVTNIISNQTASDSKIGVAISPDIYLIIPGPFGDSDQNGLWGAVVVNPTATAMEVSRIAITEYTAQHTSATQMMVRNCANTPVSPTTASEWSCPHDNQVQWKDLNTPEVIQPNEVKSFLVRVQPGGLFTGQEEPAAAVVATVYTDIGVFAKAGYTAGMTYDGQPLGNVYLTDTTNAIDALQNVHMFGHVNNVAPGTTAKFNVTFADLDNDVETYIKSGSKLIINVPPDFKDVTVTSFNSFNQPVVQKRADGYTQIIASTSGHTGDTSGAGEAKIISFTATSPSPTKPTIYIMTVFNEGLTECNPVAVGLGCASFSAGALAEVAIQVNKVP